MIIGNMYLCRYVWSSWMWFPSISARNRNFKSLCFGIQVSQLITCKHIIYKFIDLLSCVYVFLKDIFMSITIVQVLSMLKYEKGNQMPQEYFKSFKEACVVFHHARIYVTFLSVAIFTLFYLSIIQYHNMVVSYILCMQLWCRFKKAKTLDTYSRIACKRVV